MTTSNPWRRRLYERLKDKEGLPATLALLGALVSAIIGGVSSSWISGGFALKGQAEQIREERIKFYTTLKEEREKQNKEFSEDRAKELRIKRADIYTDFLASAEALYQTEKVFTIGMSPREYRDYGRKVERQKRPLSEGLTRVFVYGADDIYKVSQNMYSLLEDVTSFTDYRAPEGCEGNSCSDPDPELEEMDKMLERFRKQMCRELSPEPRPGCFDTSN